MIFLRVQTNVMRHFKRVEWEAHMRSNLNGWVKNGHASAYTTRTALADSKFVCSSSHSMARKGQRQIFPESQFPDIENVYALRSNPK